MFKPKLKRTVLGLAAGAVPIVISYLAESYREVIGIKAAWGMGIAVAIFWLVWAWDVLPRIKSACIAAWKAFCADATQNDNLELPAMRPIIVPSRYGGGREKRDVGYTGLHIVNDGEAAYDVAPKEVQIGKSARIQFKGHVHRLTKGEEAFFPAFIEQDFKPGMFGSALFSMMVERDVDDIEVPLRYRDANMRWYESKIKLERDLEQPGGLRLDSQQRRIAGPK